MLFVFLGALAACAAENPQKPASVSDVKKYDDVRAKDMSGVDLSKDAELPATLTFDDNSVWPAAASMPKGFDPKALATAAMNPGLGLRELHASGVTGKGVNIGVIDQPLLDDHPEFAGKIAAYFDAGCEGQATSSHGPAVASLIVGTNCGAAPEARIYYAAVPSRLQDAACYAKALDWIVEQNGSLPEGQGIQCVCVAAAPSGPAATTSKNTEAWDEAVKRAEAARITVLDCTFSRRFVAACWREKGDVEDPASYRPGYPGIDLAPSNGYLLIPGAPRTVAEENERGKAAYAYTGRSPLNWAVPYCAGVLALGWQVNAGLSGDQMRELLLQSAYRTKEGYKIINPKEFINAVRARTVAKAR